MMTQIPFSEYLPYFKEKFEGIEADLLSAGTLSQHYDFRFFVNYAELNEDATVQYTTDEESQSEELTPMPNIIDVLIINNGTITDPTISIDAYLQSVKFEIITKELFSDDINLILDTFSNQYKSFTEPYLTNTFQLSMKEGVHYDRLVVNATDCISANFDLSIVVFMGVLFSNDVTLYINGVQIKNVIFDVNRETELNPDLKKTTNIQFYPNTSTMSVHFKGVYSTDNLVIESLAEDCNTASSFNQLFSIDIYRFKDTASEYKMLSDNYYVKSSHLSYSYGSLASIECTFYRGITL